MEAVDWAGLGVLAGLMVGCVGYLSRKVDRAEDRLEALVRTEIGEVRSDLRSLSDA